MSTSPQDDPWYSSRYTGLFTEFGAIPLLPHDPQVPMWGAVLARFGARQEALGLGGAGWDRAAAEAACVGEAIERLHAAPAPGDDVVTATYADFPRDEPAVAPERFVLFHDEQHAQPGFPFPRFDRRTSCQWLCFRAVPDGEPVWVPSDFAYLFGGGHRICPSVSTGLSCGRHGDPVLLRGLQEVIERDAVLGAWWGRYPLREWPAADVLNVLSKEEQARVRRPNLTYRFYRVDTPYAAHVTLTTLHGEDRAGSLFSIGAACRETRRASFRKSMLEAIQGRHYVRLLKQQALGRPTAADAVPRDFADHAVYYSLHPEQLRRTVLHAAASPAGEDPSALRAEAPPETLGALRERLGPARAVLLRNLTPPAVAAEHPEWYVLRVVVPGLQPLHGDAALPHLGGPLWAPRGVVDFRGAPPHPFP